MSRIKVAFAAMDPMFQDIVKNLAETDEEFELVEEFETCEDLHEGIDTLGADVILMGFIEPSPSRVCMNALRKNPKIQVVGVEELNSQVYLLEFTLRKTRVGAATDLGVLSAIRYAARRHLIDILR